MSDIQRVLIFNFILPNGLTGIVPIQTVYLGRELFAFEANVGGDDEEAEDIVIEREQVNYQTLKNSEFPELIFKAIFRMKMIQMSKFMKLMMTSLTRRHPPFIYLKELFHLQLLKIDLTIWMRLH